MIFWQKENWVLKTHGFPKWQTFLSLLQSLPTLLFHLLLQSSSPLVSYLFFFTYYFLFSFFISYFPSDFLHLSLTLINFDHHPPLLLLFFGQGGSSAKWHPLDLEQPPWIFYSNVEYWFGRNFNIFSEVIEATN